MWPAELTDARSQGVKEDPNHTTARKPGSLYKSFNGRCIFPYCTYINYVWSHSAYITIHVPLFKKMRDIIFFLRDNNFLSRFEGHFEGAKTFLTP